MSAENYIDYLSLSLYLSIWCFLHSAMISPSVTLRLKQSLDGHYRYYRLFYNFFALITLFPIILFKYSLQTKNIVQWSDDLLPLQIFLIGLALLLFYLGAKKYDSKRFIGLRQLTEEQSLPGISSSGKLDASGILSLIRHPWYTALLLILWTQSMDLSTLIVNCILTGYLFIGIHLEEKKLVAEFGQTYRDYQQSVDMLIPFNAIKKRF